MATKTAPKNRIETNGKPEPPASLFRLDKLRIKVVGITPLLCSNPAPMQPKSSDTARAKSKVEATPEAICRQAAYFDAEGNCAFPNSALRSAILDAAGLMKIRMGSGTYAKGAESILRTGLSFDHEVRFTKLLHPVSGEPLTEKDYQIDMQRAVNQKSGGAITAIRARFDQWAAVFYLLVDSGNADLMALLASHHFGDILGFSGMNVGLGAYRAYIRPKGKNPPGGNGPYGKYGGSICE